MRRDTATELKELRLHGMAGAWDELTTTDRLASRRRSQAAPGSYLNWKRLLLHTAHPASPSLVLLLTENTSHAQPGLIA